MKKKSKGERQVFLLASGKVSYFFSLKKIPETKDEIKSAHGDALKKNYFFKARQSRRLY